MKFVVSGRTILGETQTGIFGSNVQLFDADPSSSDAEILESQITNRNGEFSFRLRGQVLEDYAKNQKTIYVQAFDTEARTLSDPQPIVVKVDQVQNIELMVEAARIAGANLPPQPRAEPVVPKSVFDTIDLAIKNSVEATDIENTRLVAQNFYCTLPPIQDLDDILDIADGVLRGRPEDMRRFQTYLDNMEAWNLKINPSARRQLNAQQAADLLSDDVLNDLIERIDAARLSGLREGIVPIQSRITLLAAAMRIGVNNPILIHRNLGIIIEQFCLVRGLDQLHEAALGSLSGSLAERASFLQTLDILGGECGPAGLPGPAPPEASPIPCGTPFWPPDPEDPTPPGDPRDPEGCTPELVRGFREAMEREVVYIITSVTPKNACPGQEITIRGTNFEFEGRTPDVLFPGRPRGTKIRATPTRPPSPTEIKVVVPPGAACGPLELYIPGGGTTVFACGASVELFHGPETGSFEFEGGATTIEFFTAGVIEGCLNAGDELIFRWRTCNADSTRLDISGDDGTLFVSETDDRTDVDGRFTFSIPALDRDTRITATLVAENPSCGTDEERISFNIRRGSPLSSEEFTSFRLNPFFSNWHGNVTRFRVGVATPTTLDELVNAVRTAETLAERRESRTGSDFRLGVEGTRWSYTYCMVPERSPALLIDTSELKQIIEGVLDEAALDTVQSVLSPGASGRIDREVAISAGRDPETTPPVPIRDRLVHVEAGIKLWDLNCQLDRQPTRDDPEPTPLAIPNLGGSRGQSLAGAINTGTHGATFELPPIPDLVRAIHLVANGGQQWWIERRSKPVTDEAKMRDLMAEEVLDPCLKLEYNDPLFDACLVAMGQAGIVYSMVVETVPLHYLFEETRLLDWETVKREIQDKILDPLDPAEPSDWYYEVSVNPTPGRPAWVTTRKPAPAPEEPPPCDPPASGSPLTDALWITLFGTTAAALGPAGLIGLGTGALAFVMGGLGLYFFRRSAELARIFTFEWWRVSEILEIQEELDLIEQLIDSVDDIVDAINAAVRGDAEAAEQALAEALPDLVSALWRTGFYVVSGHDLLNTIQNLFTNLDQRPPGTDIGKSYTIFTEQPDCTCPDAEHEQTHSAIEKLIHSQEYAVPADQLIPFAEAILDEADYVRNVEDDALILILNLRFVRKTEAMMGLQQYSLTGLAEVWTVDGLEGNASFYARVNRLANNFEEFKALPHWGHDHEEQDLSGRFLRRAAWKRQLDMIARSAGRPNIFRHRFAKVRGLLDDL